MMGIDRKLLIQSCPLNVKILLGFLMLIFGTFCDLMYVIYDAKTFAEYTQTIYASSLGFLIFFALLVILFKVDELFAFMDDCNSIVNTRGCQNLMKNNLFKPTVDLSFFSRF